MVTNGSDLTIVQSTIDLAHRLGLQVVAEGVEDAETFDRLARIGCDQAQGCYLRRPVRAEAVTQWLLAARRSGRMSIKAKSLRGV